MSDSRITDLQSILIIDDNDVIEIVDTNDYSMKLTGTNKKVKIIDLKNLFTPENSDQVPEGSSHLYTTLLEKLKLAGIEDNADVNLLNTISSSGTGVSIIKEVVNKNIKLKTLKASNNIIFTITDDDITISSNVLFTGAIVGAIVNSSPNGFLPCKGGLVSRTLYSNLFSVIGTTFGVGDGSTTFALPDYRGKFLRGLGGNSAGDFVTTQNEGLPNITGYTASFQRGNTGAYSGALYAAAIGTMNVGAGAGTCMVAQLAIDASLSSSIYGASTHVTPINQALNYFIRY